MAGTPSPTGNRGEDDDTAVAERLLNRTFGHGTVGPWIFYDDDSERVGEIN